MTPPVVVRASATPPVAQISTICTFISFGMGRRPVPASQNLSESSGGFVHKSARGFLVTVPFFPKSQKKPAINSVGSGDVSASNSPASGFHLQALPQPTRNGADASSDGNHEKPLRTSLRLTSPGSGYFTSTPPFSSNRAIWPIPISWIQNTALSSDAQGS